MSTPTPVLAVRGSSGIILNQGPPSYEVVSSFPRVTSKNCKCMLFSPNGQYFAWFDGTKISIADTSSWKILAEIEKPKTACLYFSPKGTYLASWEPFVVNKENPKGSPNLYIWKSEDGSLVHEYVHKKQITWQPHWSKDERIFANAVEGEVLLYEKNNFTEPKYKISKPKVNDFSFSPTPSPCYVLCYMPGTTGPCFGKMFKYPKFEQCVANKTFFKADRVEMQWNNKGTYVLLLASEEVDKTGSSYYGKSSLHFLSVKGDTAIVFLNKDGPIYDVKWNPWGEEFCVVYGFMPSKATLFNNKCEAVYEFGSAHRNTVHYNPYGNILLLGGFGNINGHVELWDVATHKKITNFSAPNTTFLQWSPDGCHFVTATTAPRLRVANGFKIWHYSGALLYERPWNNQEELWEVCWQVFPEGVFKKPTVSYKQVEGIQSSEPVASKEVYRPPGARGLPSPAKKLGLYDDDAQSNTRKISKMALKTKKKRESKRQAKQLEEEQKKMEGGEQSSKNNGEVTANGDAEHVNASKNNSRSGGQQNNNQQHSDVTIKLKKVRANLRSIQKLKELKSSGQKLDPLQLKKIEREPELLKELEQLEIK